MNSAISHRRNDPFVHISAGATHHTMDKALRASDDVYAAADGMDYRDGKLDGGSLSILSNMFIPAAYGLHGDVSFTPDIFAGTAEQPPSPSPPQSPQTAHQPSLSSKFIHPAVLNSEDNIENNYEAEGQLDLYEKAWTRSSNAGVIETQSPTTQNLPPTFQPSPTTPRSRPSRPKSNRIPGKKLVTASPSPSSESSEYSARQREKCLQRNRAAAHRCRQKKKEWAARLDERCHELKARHALLEDEAGELRREVYELKNLVLEHNNCSFPPIDTYISKTAEVARCELTRRGKA